LIFAWSLQQCSATVLPVITVDVLLVVERICGKG